MKTKLHIIIIVTLSLVWLILSTDAAASEWFVRPAGGNYGSEDGTSYENAWDGLLNVVWGAGGVEADDTLYICGLHLRTYAGSPQWEIIGPVTSGTSDSNRVTIRGDYPGDQGIIWGAGILAVNSWSYEGDNTYSMSYPSSHHNNWVFEDVTASSWTVLDGTGSIEECKDTPGSFYMDSSIEIIYVHTSDNGDPTNRIAINRAGYYFNLGNVQYVTFKNLEAYSDSAHNMFINGLGGDNANHIRFEGCTIWYGGAAMMHFRRGNNYIEFYNCDIAWAENGLDFSEGDPTDGSLSPSNVIISNNTFHDIGVTYTDRDAHAVSWQGGRNNLIEKNEMYNCGTTICFYQLNNQGVQNTTIRWNYIHDSHTLGGANGFGIELAGDGDDRHNNTGNAIYGNIVQNCTIGYRYRYVQEHPFYNNIAYNCGTSFYSLGSGVHPDDLSYNIKMRNDISLFPTNYHIEARTNGDDHFVFDSDYNIFYPDTGNKFLLADLGSTRTMNFAGWQNLVRPGSTFDPNTIIADPMFVDPDNGDFRLQAGSPAIDAGIDVGLTEDFEGNSIPQGTAPDIGAYEYTLLPVVVIQNEPKQGYAPLTVSFDGSLSTSPNGDIVSYEWDFGDGSTSTGMKTSHIFTSPGEYTVTLTVTDDHGWKGKSQTRITVFEKEFGQLPAGCYNNVFNPTKGERALIVVELPKQAHIRLNLYNTRGNKIKELADEQKEAGTHKYYWDGKSGNGDVVGSGLYFVHIQAGDYKKTKKIVVVK